MFRNADFEMLRLEDVVTNHLTENVKQDSSESSTDKIVQIKNPKTGDYTRINRSKGKITGHKSSPYKGIPIIKRKRVKV